MYSKRLYRTYLLDELFNNLDNMFVELIKEEKEISQSIQITLKLCKI